MDTVDQFINLTTECLHNTQNVVKDLVKAEYTYIPVPSFIQILYSAFPDRNCEEYRILDTGTGNEINRIFRHEGENKPFFIYIPFKGKEYIITSTVPGAFLSYAVLMTRHMIDLWRSMKRELSLSKQVPI